MKFLCSVGVFSEVCLAEAIACKRHGWRQARNFERTCTTLLATDGKKSPSGRNSHGLMNERISLLAPESPSLQACADFASCQRLPGNCYFWIHFIFYLFLIPQLLSSNKPGQNYCCGVYPLRFYCQKVIFLRCNTGEI